MTTRLLLVLAAASFPLREAAAQDARYEVDEKAYAEAGTHEIGGDVAVSWNRDAFQFDFGPSIGLFVSDNLELSALFRLSHVRTGGGEGTTSGSVLLEPSLHLPLSADEAVFAFGGVGVGLGYQRQTPDFEIVPRVGINTRIGRSGILTPALRMPMQFRTQAPAQVGLAFEIGVGTVF